MLWTWPMGRAWSTWDEMARLQQEVNRLFEPLSRNSSGGNGEFPAVNIWTSEEDALLIAEIPGMDPDNVEVTVKNNAVTIRGTRQPEALGENQVHLRQERGAGRFVRSFALPFQVDADKVTAHYQKGILQLTLPRAEADKPKKIAINAA